MNGRDPLRNDVCGSRSPAGRERRRARTEPGRHQDQQHQRGQDEEDDPTCPQERGGGGGGLEWPRRSVGAQTQPPPGCRMRLPDARPEVVVVPENRTLTAAIEADGYRLGATVGHGSYSKVRVAVRLVAAQEKDVVHRVACKVIDKQRRGTGGVTSTYVSKFLPRELEVLRVVRHPNVVRTHRIYVAPSTVLVFMDYCELGDLLGHLQRAKSVPQWQAHMFFK